MIMHYPRFLFPFEANHLPRNCRKVRSGWFLGSESVELREAEPDEVVPAFRIRYENGSGYARSYEVLAFKGQCWWPLQEVRLPNNHFYLVDSAAAFLNGLATFGHDLLGLLPDGIARPPAVEDVPLRNFDPSMRESALNRIKERIYSNFMLSEGRAYVLGGEPIHLSGQEMAKTDDAVNSGADRSEYPSHLGLKHPPGRFSFNETQYALRNGHFFAAHDRDALSREVEAYGRRRTTIDVLEPAFARFCKPQALLDALYRETVGLRDFAARYRPSSHDQYEACSELASLAFPENPSEAEDSAITSERLMLLEVAKDILARWSPPVHTGYNALRWQILRFLEKESAFVAEHRRSRLTTEENNAIECLRP
jgi:hypothetical protein